MNSIQSLSIAVTLLLLSITSVRAQDSLKYHNVTEYTTEYISHNSPNPGANQHLLGWLTNTSTLSLPKGHSLYLSLMLTHGGEPSANIVGDLQTFSNIEAGFLYGFYEAYYRFSCGDFWVKIGQQDLNTDLLLTQTGSFYTHSSFGIDPVTAVDFPTPTYPATAFAITSSIPITTGLSLKSGIFDGRFSAPKDNFLRLNWSLGQGQGYLLVFEPALSLLRGKWIQKVGFHHHTGKFERKDNGNLQQGLSTLYLLGDIKLKDQESQKIDIFYQYSRSTNILSDLDYYFGLGLKITNPWRSKDSSHELGLALAYASINSDFYRVRDIFNITSETAIEISYKTKVNDWLNIQPYLHYLATTNNGNRNRNTLIIALRAYLNINDMIESLKP